MATFSWLTRPWSTKTPQAMGDTTRNMTVVEDEIIDNLKIASIAKTDLAFNVPDLVFDASDPQFAIGQGLQKDTPNTGANNGPEEIDAWDNRKTIQATIDACELAGGGEVWIPPGRYVVGNDDLVDTDLHAGTGNSITPSLFGIRKNVWLHGVGVGGLTAASSFVMGSQSSEIDTPNTTRIELFAQSQNPQGFIHFEADDTDGTVVVASRAMTGGSRTTIVDTGLNFTTFVKKGDVVINETQNTRSHVRIVTTNTLTLTPVGGDGTTGTTVHDHAASDLYRVIAGDYIQYGGVTGIGFQGLSRVMGHISFVRLAHALVEDVALVSTHNSVIPGQGNGSYRGAQWPSGVHFFNTAFGHIQRINVSMSATHDAIYAEETTQLHTYNMLLGYSSSAGGSGHAIHLFGGVDNCVFTDTHAIGSPANVTGRGAFLESTVALGSSIPRGNFFRYFIGSYEQDSLSKNNNVYDWNRETGGMIIPIAPTKTDSPVVYECQGATGAKFEVPKYKLRDVVRIPFGDWLDDASALSAKELTVGSLPVPAISLNDDGATDVAAHAYYHPNWLWPRGSGFKAAFCTTTTTPFVLGEVLTVGGVTGKVQKLEAAGSSSNEAVIMYDNEAGGLFAVGDVLTGAGGASAAIKSIAQARGIKGIVLYWSTEDLQAATVVALTVEIGILSPTAAGTARVTTHTSGEVSLTVSGTAVPVDYRTEILFTPATDTGLTIEDPDALAADTASEVWVKVTRKCSSATDTYLLKKWYLLSAELIFHGDGPYQIGTAGPWDAPEYNRLGGTS